MFIPKSLYYTKNHLWLRQVGLYDYFVGITDFAQKEIGEISLIELEFTGEHMKKEMQWGKIYGLNQTFSLLAPIDCKVMATNVILDTNPSSINRDPYNNWFLRVSTVVSNYGLLTNEEYIELIQ
ncbi:glycine cleavage system protein H [Flavobacterium johnsoniae]|uniref:Glycine cleavage H-protein n=1 Tax=Flavobacterium johnsoniae (strain ATCC 17061 / DSM 2064 / JCM 8514 / BCRC 14874 / CCUG 350202 / NBRC 14942 / NCIMB 11054 / UW101) TaxID=376686 RepID=A5FBF7_FLAJ1|nr:glycine cleavage system protein H [Flavobacterium johnsoniae]ABQ07455.1 glycine cleavage H-protein [Flavobacterium johnsoniae UW101]OXE99358.1 glycine cleavage system protein H [Flavobacterium johnsoniae UW101]WQG80711.1 glycine cleavage system protein H [Flavobacterium johnsoniae UW101]SHL12575.1 glycine cleavage system H protein [Flavobacterium johnsoniae]